MRSSHSSRNRQTQAIILTVTFLLVSISKVTPLATRSKRQDSECHYLYITQPPRNLTCNPFTNGLRLQCSLSVENNLPGNLDIEWYHSSGSEWPPLQTELSPGLTTLTVNGTVVTSTLSVDNPQTGFYFCVPEASQNRLVNSTATLVLSQDVYFHNPPCVAEEFLSIPQLECAQTSTETDIVTPPGLSPDPQTTVGTDSTQMATTVAATEVLQQVILYVSIGAVIFSIVIICCGVIMAVHYCKKRRRNRFPKSKGQRSRVVTDNLNISRRRSGSTLNSSPLVRTPPTMPPPVLILPDSQDQVTTAPTSNYEQPQVIGSCSYVDANPRESYEEITDYTMAWMQSPGDYRSEWLQPAQDTGKQDSVATTNSIEDGACSTRPESYIIPHPCLRRYSSSSVTAVSHSDADQREFTSSYVPYAGSGCDSDMYYNVCPTLEAVTEGDDIQYTTTAKKHVITGGASARPADKSSYSCKMQVQCSLPNIISKKPKTTPRKCTTKIKPTSTQEHSAKQSSIQDSSSSNGHVYQGLKHETMNYLSLYHTINKTAA